MTNFSKYKKLVLNKKKYDAIVLKIKYSISISKTVLVFLLTRKLNEMQFLESRQRKHKSLPQNFPINRDL